MLPIVGTGDPRDSKMVPEERRVCAALVSAYQKILPTKNWKGPKATSISTWCSYYRGRKDSVNAAERHAAFVLLWLSKFVFGGFPNGRIISDLAPMAVRLSFGHCIPLAPVLLGTIYHQLDKFVENEKAGAGFFPLQTPINYPVLQMFLWEHYPSFFHSHDSEDNIRGQHTST